MIRSREVLRGMTDMVFPPVCVHCGGLVEGGALRHLCTACEPLIHFVKVPCCTTCGSPFFGEVEGERMCPHCEGLHPLYGEGRTLTLFKGPARALIHGLKYHHGHHLLGDIEQLVRRSAHITDFIRGRSESGAITRRRCSPTRWQGPPAAPPGSNGS